MQITFRVFFSKTITYISTCSVQNLLRHFAPNTSQNSAANNHGHFNISEFPKIYAIV